MKPVRYLILFSILILGCKNDTNSAADKQKVEGENTKELTVANKIANAHGFKHWNNVKEIEFAFSVDREEPGRTKRHWKWQPKTQDVTMTLMVDSILNGERMYVATESQTYNRTAITTDIEKIDRRFINDKFWLFIPFQLVWDEGTTISEPIRVQSPLLKKELNMIKVLYSKGGYTPGDAYDIYYNDNYLIQEWGFRRANAPEPSIQCTFENYQDFNGIKLALFHKKPNDAWNLKFTGVKVIQDE
jgi:hypothetical protein